PVILQALMVAPQPLFDAERRLIGTRIGVGGHAFRMQRDFRIQMNGAFGAKAKTFALQRGMSRIAAVEILAHRFGDPRLDTPAQCLADLNVFSGDAKRHACLRAVASLPRSDGTLSAYSTYVSYRAESTLAASLKRRATVRRWRISGQRRDLLVAPALHRRRNAQGFAVFGHGAPRNVDPGLAQPFDDGIVGQYVSCALGIDQLLDAVPYRLGGMRLTAVRGRNGRGEEIFQLENAAARRHVLVGGHARHR